MQTRQGIHTSEYCESGVLLWFLHSVVFHFHAASSSHTSDPVEPMKFFFSKLEFIQVLNSETSTRADPSDLFRHHRGALVAATVHGQVLAFLCLRSFCILNADAVQSHYKNETIWCHLFVGLLHGYSPGPVSVTFIHSFSRDSTMA